MATLSLKIDAAPAAAGAAQFVSSAAAVGRSAADAAGKTRDLDRATDALGKREKEAAETTRKGREETERSTRSRDANRSSADNSVRALGNQIKELLREADALRNTTSERDRGSRATTTSASTLGTESAARDNLTRTILRQADSERALRRESELTGRSGGGLAQLTDLSTVIGPAGAQLATFSSQAQASSSALSSLFGVAGTGAAVFGGLSVAAVGIGAAFVKAAEDGRAFEQSMQRIVTLLPNVAGSASAAGQAVIATSTKFGVPKEQVIAGEEIIRRQYANQAAQQQEKSVASVQEASAKLARATGRDFSVAAAIVTSSLDAFGQAADRALNVAGSVNQGAVISTKPIEDYADALSTLGPTASKAGFGLTDIATALAITAQSSRSAGQAGAGIQRLILAIADESDATHRALADLGVDFSRAADGSRDFSRIIQDISRVTGGSADVLAQIFGNRDTPTVFAALTADAKAYQAVQSEIAGGVGTLNDQFRTADALASSTSDKLKAARDAFFVDIDKGGLGEAFTKYQERLNALQPPESSPVAGNSGDSFLKFLQAKYLQGAASSASNGLATVSAPADAEKRVRGLLADFERALSSSGGLPPVPIELAITTQPEELRKAYERIVASLGSATPQLAALDQDSLESLNRATTEFERSSDARGKAIEAEQAKQDAARKTLDAYRNGLEDESAAVNRTEREIVSLTAQREGERLARLAGIADYQAEGRALRDLALRIRDLRAVKAANAKEEADERAAEAAHLALIAKYGAFIPEQRSAGPEQPAPQSEAFGPFATDNQLRGNERFNDLVNGLHDERDALRLTDDERERANFLRELESAGIQAGISDLDQLIAKYDEEFQSFQRMRQLTQLGKDIGREIGQGFEEAVFSGKKLSDVLNQLGRDIAQLAFRQAVTNPLSNLLGNAIGGFLGGGGAGGQSGGGSGGIFARGGAFDGGGELHHFAYGDVFDQPTNFGFGRGKRGQLGEAGPETILPLARGPNGKLGVQATGGGESDAPTPQPTVHKHYHTWNVQALDAGSFGKQSQRQIAQNFKRATRS